MLFYKITATISENIDIPSSKQREEYEEYASSFPDVNEMFYQKNHKQCYLFVAGIKSHFLCNIYNNQFVQQQNVTKSSNQNHHGLTFISVFATFCRKPHYG